MKENPMYVAQKCPESGVLKLYNIEQVKQIPLRELCSIAVLYTDTIKVNCRPDLDISKQYKITAMADDKVIWYVISGVFVWSVETYVDEDLQMVCDTSVDDDDEEHGYSLETYNIEFPATIAVAQKFDKEGISAGVSMIDRSIPIKIPNVNAGFLCSGIDRRQNAILSPSNIIKMLCANVGNMDYRVDVRYPLDDISGINSIDPEQDHVSFNKEIDDVIKLHLFYNK